MKKAILAALSSVTFLHATGAKAEVNYDFSGHWQGSGKVQEEEMLGAVDANFTIDIKNTNTNITIQECWTIPDKSQKAKKTCYDSDYSINQSGQIFSAGEKIGDAFPKYIIIFQGNTQVSEQMKFGIDSSGALIFHYTYANYDGGTQVRSSKLTRKSNIRGL